MDKTGIHENAYSIVVHQPEDEMTRIYDTGNGNNPFSGVYSIQQLENNTVRITYSGNRKDNQKLGHVFEFHSGGTRETAGAFTWESKNVTAQNVNVHFMHGFGWLVQMSENVYYRNCNFMPRDNSGHLAVSYADGIHASGAKGDFVIENCNFAHVEDDPINMHGTFTRVEQRVNDNTLKLRYIHNQQGGFPQFHVGDQVQFFTRDTLESTDGEAQYTVAEVISNPGEDGNDLRTMVIRFEETLPANLSDTTGGQPKYVAENVTYAPSVTIKGCTFKNISTRGILCTTRNKVVIEDNIFYPTSMASIFLSNDSNDWYESGPIRDMTIRNNIFYVKDIGGKTSWTYASAIYIHPVTKGGGLPEASNPIHKNITIEGNTFYMDEDTVVKAESVENLKFINNKVLRMNPDVSISISLPQTNIGVDENAALHVNAEGNTNSQNIDNVFDFTKSKDVLIEGNTYDDGLKLYAVDRNSENINLDIKDEEITIVTSDNKAPADPVQDIVYVSSDPSVAIVDNHGVITGKDTGSANIFAYYLWNGTMIRSNTVKITVTGESEVPGEEKETITIAGNDNVEVETGETYAFTVEEGKEVTWSVVDFETSGAADAAVISEEGVLTANKPGVVWVVAASGDVTDRKAVVISGVTSAGLNSGFSITREDDSAYTLEDTSVEIAMQTGDLWEDSNTLKNLFLYNPTVAKDNLRTVIKVEGLPIRESGQWDTASFILYKDDNNYVTIGKKSHYDGFATVVETNGSAPEQDDDAADNNVTTAYLGFTKVGNTISMDVKAEGGEWKQVRELTSSPIGDDYQIGFGCWHSNNRGKKVTFSEFHVGTADKSYDELCAEAPMAFVKQNLNRPVVSNVQLTTDGTNATVHYQFTDADGDAEGRSFYRFTYEKDGVETTVISAEKTISAVGVDEISCQVYPADQYGNPGTPSEVKSASFTAENTTELYAITVNGQTVYTRGDSKEIDLWIPAEASKIILSYLSVNNNIGTTAISKNDQAIDGTYGNSGEVILTAANNDTIKIVRGENVYTIKVAIVESDNTDLAGIAVEGLGFSETALEDSYYYLNAASDQRNLTLNVTKTEACGSVEILAGDYRAELETAQSGQKFTANLTLKNGLNTFYVKAIAKDGITEKQYIIAITYTPSSEVAVDGITVDGAPLAGFEADTYTYFYEMGLTADSLTAAVTADPAENVRISFNGTVVNKADATFTEFKEGENTLIVAAFAPDGIGVKRYTITVIKPYETNTNVQTVTLNGKEISEGLSTEKANTIYVTEDENAFSIAAQDSRAVIAVKQGQETVLTGTGSVSGTITAYSNANTFTAEITAADGKTKESYTITLEKAVYLSDIKEESYANGWGVFGKDMTCESNPIRLPGENGSVVTFEKGLGTHANSKVVYNVAGKGYKALQGYAGIDCEVNGSTASSVTFTIKIDGETVFNTDVMYSSTPMKAFDIEIPETAQTITLEADMGASNGSDHADWADAKFVGSFEEKPEEPPVDKTALMEAIGKAAEYEAVDYTEESYAKLEKAIEDAGDVLNDENAAAEDVAEAIAAIDAAIKGLEEASTECRHLNKETLEAVAPTCTEKGLTAGQKCSDCGEILVKQEEIPATGHTEVVDKAVEATCKEAGKTEGKHCSVCNEVLVKQEVIPAAGHTWSEWTVVKEATTEEAGRKERTCSVCGEKESEVIPKPEEKPEQKPEEKPEQKPDSPVTGDNAQIFAWSMVTFMMAAYVSVTFFRRRKTK